VVPTHPSVFRPYSVGARDGTSVNGASYVFARGIRRCGIFASLQANRIDIMRQTGRYNRVPPCQCY